MGVFGLTKREPACRIRNVIGCMYIYATLTLFPSFLPSFLPSFPFQAHKGHLAYCHLRLLRENARHHYDPVDAEKVREQKERFAAAKRRNHTDKFLRGNGIKVTLSKRKQS